MLSWYVLSLSFQNKPHILNFLLFVVCCPVQFLRVFVFITLAKCPKGDDPLTINQNYRSILLTVASTGSYDLEGQLGLNFMGETVMLTLSDATTSLCTNELAFHGPFGHALCSVTQLTRLKFQFTFTFYSWPTYPKTNNLFSHDGNPSKYDFYCDTTHVTAFTTCVFTDIEASNIQGIVSYEIE